MIGVFFTYPTFLILIAMHTFKTLCILDVLFYIAYSARYSLFVLMCRKTHITHSLTLWGWSGGAMVLGKLPVPGRPTILITVGQGPIALAVGAGGGGLDIFTLICPFSSFSLSLGDGSI